MVLIIAALAAGLAGFDVIWNHFFRGVPQLFDAGWYAFLVHRNVPLLQNPPSVAFATIGPDYYATHFSPLLWLLSWPSYLVPVGPQVWLGCVEALKYGLLAAVVWLTVRECKIQAESDEAGGSVAAGLIVLLAPFNGVVLAAMAYPHFESWFVVFSLAFFLALFSGRARLALAPFIATLLLREDMGFHLCGVLLLASAARWIARGQGDRSMRTWLFFAGSAFVWSGAALLLMRLYFPGDGAFGRVYAGHPPFAHLSWSELGRRLVFQYQARGFVWMPAAVYLVWAAVSRAWWVLLGYVAFVPWFILNLSARSLAPATLSLHYSFPFGLALLWPAAGWLAFGGTGPSSATHFRWIAAALVASIVGFVRGNDWRPLARDMLVPTSGTKTALQATTTELAGAAARGVPTGVDDAIAALAPGNFRAGNLLGQTPAMVSLAGLYSNGRLAQMGWEVSRRLPFHYRLRGTPVVVVSAEPLAWPYLEFFSSQAGSVLPFLHGAPALAWTPRKAGKWQAVCTGPDWYLPAGQNWTAEFVLWLKPPAKGGPSSVSCEVTGRNGGVVIARANVPLATLPPGWTRISPKLVFVVPPRLGATVETRIIAPADSAGQVEDVVLQKQEPVAAEAASPPPPP